MSRIAAQFRPQAKTVCYLVWQRQCRLIKLKQKELLITLIFFLTVISSFHIAIGQGNMPIEVASATLFSSWLFALMLPFSTMLENDFRRGFLQQFYLTGVWFELIVLAQYLGYIAYYVILCLLVFPLAMLLLHIDWNLWPVFIAGGLLLTLSVGLILMLCNALVLGSASHTLIGIIALPLAIPCLILITLSTQQAAYLLVMLALWLGLVPLCILATSTAVIAAFEDG